MRKRSLLESKGEIYCTYFEAISNKECAHAVDREQALKSIRCEYNIDE